MIFYFRVKPQRRQEPERKQEQLLELPPKPQLEVLQNPLHPVKQEVSPDKFQYFKTDRLFVSSEFVRLG